MKKENNTLLKIKDVSKSFGVVKALKDVNVEIEKGQVLGLIGENGAGKSTLVNILGGMYKKDSGEIWMEGRKTDLANPIESMKAGITIVPQELTVLDYLNVTENRLVGNLPKINNTPIVNWRDAARKAQVVLKKLNVKINQNKLLSDLSVADKRIVEIARAIYRGGKLLILDEPTTALSEKEVKDLFGVVNEIKKNGVSVIFISHLLDEVIEISDRIAILRDGEMVCDKRCDLLDRNQIVKFMVGKSIDEQYPKKEPKITKQVLKVERLNHEGYFRDIDFVLKRGEILAFYGLLGSGCTEVARTIFGIYLKDKGNVKIEDKELKIKDPVFSIKKGVGLVPSDRKFEGILPTFDVKQNITLANIKSLGSNILLNKKEEQKKSKYWVDRLKIKVKDLNQKITGLSGGNQQKVIISRWLESNSKILILDEPTKGIDVGAKTEIYTIMEDICLKGAAIIMISVDIEEIMGIADRVLVFSQGRIVKELKREEITKENLIHYASKVERDEHS